jgi:hypothetical protein
MNQDEWVNCSDPKRMLNFLGEQLNDRQLKQLSVACYRKIDRYLTDEARMVVELIEAEVNGKPDPVAFKAACGVLASEVFDSSSSSSTGGVINSYVFVLTEPPAMEGTQTAINAVMRAAEWQAESTTEISQERAASLANLATILREIVGNPFSY